MDNWQAQANQIKELAEKYELKLLAMEEAALDEERLMLAFAAGAEIGIPLSMSVRGQKRCGGRFRPAGCAVGQNGR